MLNRKDKDYLDKKLYIPLYLRDVMRSGGRLKDDDKYSLHEIISNFQPDSALLAIASATLEILEMQGYQNRALKSLRADCERILGEYGPLWLEHAKKRDINDTLLFETLAQIPDDLERLAERLDEAVDFLSRVDKLAAAILDVFTIQAGAQGIIAAEYVDVMDDEAEGETAMSGFAPEWTGGNVIPFPVGNA